MFRMQEKPDNKCTHAVIGYGQWPASDNTGSKPYSQHRFRTELATVARQIQALRNTSSVRFFLNSVNYNGLGILTTSCPPIDHRTVAVIDMFNSVIQQIAQRYAISYVDLNAILGPLWDSALDYGHPVGKVMYAQIEHLLHHIFATITDPPQMPAYLVRFADGASDYLVTQGDRARAFPNGHTFMAMSYDFADVKVEPAESRDYYSFGPDLGPL